MRALTWQGKRKVSVETVPDPTMTQPDDVIIEVTSTAICGSDLHLYEVLVPFMDEGDVIGHETMGRVVDAGADAHLSIGDRVVVPFIISCGTCWMCRRGLTTQCETTQVREYGSGAALYGYSRLYGSVPGGQAEYLRVPHANTNPIAVGSELTDHRYLFLSDILPTAWQGVRYAGVGAGDSLAVYGLGPVGQFAARIGIHLGAQADGDGRDGSSGRTACLDRSRASRRNHLPQRRLRRPGEPLADAHALRQTGSAADGPVQRHRVDR